MSETNTLRARLTRKKPIEMLIGDTAGADPDHGHLKRGITPFQVTMFGVGSTIGTGIFFVLAQTVPTAGPAVVVSFAIAGIVAGLTALCYAEMASMIPVSGSSYSYAYATLGEGGVAYFVACCLILEYGISASAVAVGWSGYLNKVFEIIFRAGLPASLTAAPLVADGYSISFGGDGVINLPAAILVFLCCLLLIRGSKESAKANAIMVLIKMGVLAMFILIAITGFSASNLQPFAPFGFAGISMAAGTIFFTYVGLDAVSTAGEEVENPKRNLPLAIIAALIIVTSLYVLVALTALGVQPAPRSRTGDHSGNPHRLVLAGFGSGRGRRYLLFAMSRDGMLPEVFHRVNPRTMSPVACTVVVAIFVGAIAAFVPDAILWDLTSMGTLVAFAVVSTGVIILRQTRPDMPRGFKVPLYPVLPILSIVSCFYLVSSLNPTVFKLFGVWLPIAAIFYFAYSARNSRLEKLGAARSSPAAGS
jgi:APA family basic amino acid/polyamine antiporter